MAFSPLKNVYIYKVSPPPPKKILQPPLLLLCVISVFGRNIEAYSTSKFMLSLCCKLKLDSGGRGGVWGLEWSVFPEMHGGKD